LLVDLQDAGRTVQGGAFGEGAHSGFKDQRIAMQIGIDSVVAQRDSASTSATQGVGLPMIGAVFTKGLWHQPTHNMGKRG
jgi:hypothetical protein